MARSRFNRACVGSSRPYIKAIQASHYQMLEQNHIDNKAKLNNILATVQLTELQRVEATVRRWYNK